MYYGPRDEQMQRDNLVVAHGIHINSPFHLAGMAMNQRSEDRTVGLGSVLTSARLAVTVHSIAAVFDHFLENVVIYRRLGGR